MRFRRFILKDIQRGASQMMVGYAFASASVSTRPPRAALMRKEPRFMEPIRAAIEHVLRLRRERHVNRHEV